jgi:hypothetical protein
MRTSRSQEEVSSHGSKYKLSKKTIEKIDKYYEGYNKQNSKAVAKLR